MKIKKNMTDRWHAGNYSQFLELRTRPARDLLAAIPDFFQPGIVYDLGCGPGNSTILLKKRWPEARVIGLDASENMLKQAKASYPDLEFIKGDIGCFNSSEKIDCLFANASLQWLDNHEKLLPKLLKGINPGGVFAIQMPNNFLSPSHQVTVALLESNPAWQPLLQNLLYGRLTESFYQLPRYYDLLSKAGAYSLQLWETDYYQEMADHRAIFDWVKGTGLIPVLSAMDAGNQIAFAKAYINAIAQEYPLQANENVLFPYKRVFMVGFI